MLDLHETALLKEHETLVEGVARVIAVEPDQVWLEPEQSGSCGGCASSGCGAKGLGTVASYRAARRFSLRGHGELRVGDRILVGVRGDALLRAAGTAYAVPLIVMLATAGLAEYLVGRDGFTLAATLVGLLAGMALARRWAARLAARGLTQPRFLRRIHDGSACRLP